MVQLTACVAAVHDRRFPRQCLLPESQQKCVPTVDMYALAGVGGLWLESVAGVQAAGRYLNC